MNPHCYVPPKTQKLTYLFQKWHVVACLKIELETISAFYHRATTMMYMLITYKLYYSVPQVLGLAVGGDTERFQSLQHLCSAVLYLFRVACEGMTRLLQGDRVENTVTRLRRYEDFFCESE